jgi:Integrase core domain
MLFVLGLWTLLRALLFGSVAIALENLALRHQLGVLQRSVPRPRLSRWDRILWVWRSRVWVGWRSSLAIVQPATVLAWHRRGFHVNVTDHPTAVWTARQIIEAFPDDSAPRFLLRDRDAIYGEEFARRVKRMGIHEVRIAPRAPWQNPFVERVIGSLRRECLDYCLILSEAHLRRLLRAYGAYYNTTRPHQSPDNNSPQPRVIEPPPCGGIIAIPQVGGLHHRYQRVA